jgi:DNA-binding IclR family transcriptional regulator
MLHGMKKGDDLNSHHNHLETEAQKQAGAQSIRRTIALLHMIAKYNDHGVNLSKIARKVGLPTTTVHRILAVLVEEGLVAFDPGTKLYHLGIVLFTFGIAAHQFAIRDQFHSTLERIAQKTGDTAYLVMRSGIDVLCVDRVIGSYPIQVLTFEIGERRPLGIGGGSIALLASLPDDQAEAIITANASRYSSFKKKTPGDVRRMVSQCRRLGYGLSVRNVNPDMIGVGVPILNQQGQVIAAVSVAGIAKRMGPSRQKEIIELIKSEIKAVGLTPGELLNLE